MPADDRTGLSPGLAAFVSLLRARGLSVGIRAELDLARALAGLPLLNAASFRDACRATLAKSPADLELLEEAFSVLEFGFPLSAVSRRPAPSTSPPRGGRRAAAERSQPSPTFIDGTAVVRIGTYSRDAPPTPHPLLLLDAKRLAALLTGARRFRRLAATRPGRRFAHSASGRIDFLGTVRSSVRQGGEWLELRRKRRKAGRAELAVLWDVSGSMREHDREFFSLAYALHRINRRCRVLAFSTELHDLTPEIAGRSYTAAARSVANSLDVAGGGTQIARCLEEFERRNGHRVRGRTTVMILSDGWDLGEPDELRRALRGLRRRAGLLVWVNPYARRPGFQPETGAMAEAARIADAVLGPEDFMSARTLPSLLSIPD